MINQKELYSKLTAYLSLHSMPASIFAEKACLPEGVVMNFIRNGKADFYLGHLVKMCVAMGCAPVLTFTDAVKEGE